MYVISVRAQQFGRPKTNLTNETFDLKFIF